MARLQVEAVPRDWIFGEAREYALFLTASVSRADDGSPVTGLDPGNFRVAAGIVDGYFKNFVIELQGEMEWEPQDVEQAGCYELVIFMTPLEKLPKSHRYVFGIQVRTFDWRPTHEIGQRQTRRVVDQGQTIIDLISPVG